MQGYNTLWIPGVDHAGIATQNVLERELLSQGIDRHKLGREKFIKKVWEWKEHYGGTIIHQLKKLGSSCDWSRTRFTMDEKCSKAVMEIFTRLYKEGLIYQGDYIVNWCSRCHTAISDIEVEYKEKQGKLYYINYPLEAETGELTVATTRPETMLGDTAVAVHPDDERYRHFIDKTVILPLVERKIPVIADEGVNPSFGTGAVKVTPAHDPNDFEIGLRRDLPRIVVIDGEGKMTPAAGHYQGMKSDECRAKVITDLEEKGYLLTIKDHFHSVGHCYRCNTVIEPLISKQWFLSMKELAKPAIRAVKSGKVRFVPSRWGDVYLEWMENIKDWCISRQIWWGHRIPIWHCLTCKKSDTYQSAPAKCKSCGSTELKQDESVLDTWFSSALWPLSTLGWPDETDDLNRFYPTATLVTGYEIIHFWVARMIVMGIKIAKKPPFKEVLIHGIVRDAEGKKMSKSLGNAIDPLNTIETYGTDALRFALIGATSLSGQDIFLGIESIEGGRNFANKIWNLSRFILLNSLDFQFDKVKRRELILDEDDTYIISRINQVTKATNEFLSNYRFSEMAKMLYEFLWHEFCDWYVELSKFRLKSPTPAERKTTQWVLHYVLRDSMKLLHPIMPFITEEVYQRLTSESIMIAPWPVSRKAHINEEVLSQTKKKYQVITAERKIRSFWNIPAGKRLRHYIKPIDADERKTLEKNKEKLIDILPSEHLIIEEKQPLPQYPISAVTPSGTTIFIDPGEAIDLQKEMEKKKKEISLLDKNIEKSVNKLENTDFLAKAAPEAIAREREKKQEFELRRAELAKITQLTEMH
jgi:valyl-tRNA synthetase